MKQVKLVEHLTLQQWWVKPIESHDKVMCVTVYSSMCSVCLYSTGWRVQLCAFAFISVSVWVNVCAFKSNRDFTVPSCHPIINTYRSSPGSCDHRMWDNFLPTFPLFSWALLGKLLIRGKPRQAQIVEWMEKQIDESCLIWLTEWIDNSWLAAGYCDAELSDKTAVQWADGSNKFEIKLASPRIPFQELSHP